MLELIVPKKTHHGNAKNRHGSKDLKNNIDKNSVVRYSSHDSKERLQLKNQGEINWDNQRNGHKYFHQNTSAIEVSHSGNRNNTKDISICVTKNNIHNKYLFMILLYFTKCNR